MIIEELKEPNDLSHPLCLIDKQAVEIIVLLFTILSSYEKVQNWLVTPNLSLGVAPLRLMQTDRGQKVLDFIRMAREEEIT